MEDDPRSHDLPEQPDQDAGQPDEEPTDPTQRRPVSRLDRLMSAKERAEQEAARWSEIEQLGAPVPSQDPEPPRREDDTPTGMDTPPKGLSAVQPPAPDVAGAPPQHGEAVVRRNRLPPPSFPHPTDGPIQRPDQEGAASPPPPPSLTYEPPPPSLMDDETPGQRPPRPDQQPHRRYQPPSDPVEDVRLDRDGMPLPRRVTRDDLDATMVGPTAYRDDIEPPLDQPTQPHDYGYPPLSEDTVPHRATPRPGGRARITEPAPSPPPVLPPAPPSAPPPAPPATRPSMARPRPSQQQPVRPAPPPPRKKKRARSRKKLTMGCVARAFVLMLVGGIVMGMLGSVGAAIYYSQVTAPAFRGVNDINDLRARALQFQTTRIRDREGNVLYEINDPQGGRRDYVTLDDVSPWVIVATVATEERAYFVNPGFSIPAIARAVVQNYREGAVVSGASTITQQLTRALLLPEEERTERTYERKVKEIFLAAELGRRFDKTEILELYLNQIYYGNLAYGIEAAAQTYFGKSARDLNLAEASFLAGLPQAPAIYDPVTNRTGALARQQQVLALMLEAGCIDTGNSGLVLPCTTSAEIAAAQPDLLAVATREYRAPAIQARFPHWVVYVQQLLEADPTIGPAIYTSGFDVYTTIDPRLQEVAQQQVEAVLAGLADRNVGNASVIVVDVDTGALLAMVGSRDFNDESISGQVNVALTPQQPGSSIKPFTYLAAFRQGWTPATVIWDVPIEYQIPGFGTYAPGNYSGRTQGPVSVRYALANSLNIPAVLTLDHVGVPALLEVLNDVGVRSLGDPSNPNNYGLSLTLGAGEVYLLEWANAFAVIGNGGLYRPTYAIERIERDGAVVEGYPYQVPEGQRVIDAGQAYLLQNILSDTQARIPEFGQNSPLSPPYPAGAKTGTTNDYRDNWTMGFTTEIAVGVWVGNTDNSPMINVTGVTGAGPIWRGIMDAAAQWYPPREFPRPPGVFPQTVCQDDGALPSEYCQLKSFTVTELFVSDPPGPDQGLYRELAVDTFSGLLANDNCPEYVETRPYLVLPNHSQTIDTRPFIRNWLLNTEAGNAWLAQREIPPEMVNLAPPEESCQPGMPRPILVIDSPQEGSTQGNIVTVTGSVSVPNFSHYRIEFGLSHDPEGWGVVQGDTSQQISNGVLGQVDLSAFGDNPMTIRLIAFDTAGHRAEQRVRFFLVQPTPTPTPTPTETPPATPTVQPTATLTIMAPVPILTETPPPPTP